MRHKGDAAQLRDVIRVAFLNFLSQLLGFGVDTFDPSQALNMYGIDSLSGLSCQFWFHKGTAEGNRDRSLVTDIHVQSSKSTYLLVESWEGT